MKKPDNISHRELAFALENGRSLYLLGINKAGEGPASYILNTAVFSFQEPNIPCSRNDKETALFKCMFHVLLSTETREGEPPDATPTFERVDVLDVLCPLTTDTGITMRFRKNGKGSSCPIVRPL